MAKFLFLIIGFLTSFQCLAQQSDSLGRFEYSFITTIPLSPDDILQPHLGAIAMASIQIDRHEDLDLDFGLGAGVTGSTIQILDIDSTSWWQDVDERLFLLRSDLFISFSLEPLNRFSLEVGPGVEFMFYKKLKGTKTLSSKVNGEEMQFSREVEATASVKHSVRGTLGFRLIYHGTVHGIRVNIGPYFDYASFLGSEYNQEVSSRKVGIYMGVRM